MNGTKPREGHSSKKKKVKKKRERKEKKERKKSSPNDTQNNTSLPLFRSPSYKDFTSPFPKAFAGG